MLYTGYIRGGCSPIGMKKKYPIYIEEQAISFQQIAVSAGIRGKQILINPKNLVEYTQAKLVPLIKKG